MLLPNLTPVQSLAIWLAVFFGAWRVDSYTLLDRDTLQLEAEDQPQVCDAVAVLECPFSAKLFGHADDLRDFFRQLVAKSSLLFYTYLNFAKEAKIEVFFDWGATFCRTWA